MVQPAGQCRYWHLHQEPRYIIQIVKARRCRCFHVREELRSQMCKAAVHQVMQRGAIA